MDRVAICGIGIVSVLGSNTDKVTDSLIHGKSGISVDPIRKDLGFRSYLTGTISDFESPKLDRKVRKTLTDFALHSYVATQEAIAMAGWTEEEIKSPKTGLIIGNDSSSQANIEPVDITRADKSTGSIGSAQVFKALTSTVSMNLNVILGTKGACWTLSGACASGSHAIGQARDLIASGRQDRIICGGSQEITWESVCSFDATNAFSVRHDAPSQASRPFDADRDGLVPSGGAAIVALEREDLAKKRGATILGYVHAYSFSSDGSALSVPSGEGLARCMEECIERAGIGISDIDYICAHATSTPVGNVIEAGAIYNVFKNDMPWVSSLKSMTGHEMWMSGASQVVYTSLMAKSGFIARNLNFIKQEAGAPTLRITGSTVEKKIKYALLNSAGFGGTNSCLVLDFNV